MVDDIFTPRGITAAVRAARGYVEYPGTNPTMGGRFPVPFERARSIVIEVDVRLGLPEHAAWLRAALREPGWIMPKHPVMPSHETFGSNPYAQLRPARALRMRASITHHHVKGTHTAHGWRQPLRPRERAWHEAGRHHVDQETGKVFLPVDGQHTHDDTLRAKYLLTPGDTGKRLDCHPSTEWGNAHRVFFSLEGTLKNDAIVSAGEAAFNVPSVTLWNVEEEEYEAEWETDAGGEVYLAGRAFMANELHDFAARLAGTPVVVVCDSDWAHNAAVRRQAFATVLALQTAGVPAVAAAPPEGRDLGWNHAVTGHRMRAKLGVDDFLAAGGRLGEMRAVVPVGVRGLQELRNRLRRRRRKHKAEAMTHVAEQLVMVATSDHVAEAASGRIAARLGMPSGRIAARLGMPQQTVTDHVNDLIEDGELEVLRESSRRLGIGSRWFTESRLVRVLGDVQGEYRELRVAEWLASRSAS
jgi:hypothetical protein